MRPIFAILTVLILISGCAPLQQQSFSQGSMGHGMMGGAQQGPLTPLKRSVENLPSAKAATILEPKDGETIEMSTDIVKKKIGANTMRMFGYNGQIPGPLIKVRQGQAIKVYFKNNLDMETTIHSHGIRVENKNDGVPGITQDPVLPGESFLYELRFPDAGMFWYHPHVREDYQQELGLYGNIWVLPKNAEENPVDREEVLILDDIKIDEGDVFGYTEEQINHALMGRFGNIMLVNGDTDYQLSARKGEVVRFYLTNAANTRPFKISFTGTKMKVIGSDLSNYEHEFFADALIIGPAERYIVDVLFENEGVSYLRHSTHYGSYTLGSVKVSSGQAKQDHVSDFNELRQYESTINEMAALSPYLEKSPDVEWKLAINMQGMDRMMHADEDGIEYEDPMPMMTPSTTNQTLKWQMIDMKTGKENMENQYQWKVGDLVKIRMRNDPNSMHPMQHPIHFHGQRFVVLSIDGKEVENKVWKDTALIPIGKTYDLLLEISNPGEWMAHCHIAEHLQDGMMVMFTAT